MVEDITDRQHVQQLREEYLSLVSHDLRQPLTLLTGMAGFLRRELTKKGLEREATHSEAVLASAKRMNIMIQELVDSTRLEAGQMDVHKEMTDLYPLVSGVVEQVGTTEDRARIEVVASEWVPPVAVDKERFERAIINLVSNALKYSPPDAPVTVHLERSGDEAIISVIDRGIGIPSAELPYVFGRYFRSKAAKRNAEGLGLGLYITRLIMDAHGGHVRVESEVGKGSTFNLVLPLV